MCPVVWLRPNFLVHIFTSGFVLTLVGYVGCVWHTLCVCSLVLNSLISFVLIWTHCEGEPIFSHSMATALITSPRKKNVGRGIRFCPLSLFDRKVRPGANSINFLAPKCQNKFFGHQRINHRLKRLLTLAHDHSHHYFSEELWSSTLSFSHPQRLDEFILPFLSVHPLQFRNTFFTLITNETLYAYITFLSICTSSQPPGTLNRIPDHHNSVNCLAYFINALRIVFCIV